MDILLEGELSRATLTNASRFRDFRTPCYHRQHSIKFKKEPREADSRTLRQQPRAKDQDQLSQRLARARPLYAGRIHGALESFHPLRLAAKGQLPPHMLRHPDPP